jgi:hypothetical protein
MLEKLASILGANVLDSVKDLVQTFKLPPEQQLQFDSKMAELKATTETKLAEIAASDRNSARQREMAVKDNTPKYLALGITGTLAGGIVFFSFEPPTEANKAVVEMCASALRDGWIMMVAYYFGASHHQVKNG